MTPDTADPVDVSIVTVSFNCREDLAAMLDSVLLGCGSLNCQVIVVDNASADDTVGMLVAEYPDVHVIANERNLGFSAANNAGIAESTGRYVFLLNPDAVLLEGALQRLVGFMDARPHVAAAVPKLLNRDGSLQYSLRNFPKLSSLLFESMFLHRAFPSLTGRLGEMIFDERLYEYRHPVEWASGAAMFVRRETIDKVGGLDESFFLFAEEIDWFKTMAEHGERVWYVPEAEVVHRDDKRGQNPKLIGQSMYGRSQYWRKHEGPVRALFARMLLAFYLGVRALIWSVRAFTRREFALTQRRAYSAGLRDVVRDSSSLMRGGTA